MIRQLFNIMHHAVQLPLTIHLGFSAQRKTVQTLVAAQVAEHRFHCCKAARDHLTARIRFDFLFLQINMIFNGICYFVALDDATTVGQQDNFDEHRRVEGLCAFDVIPVRA